MVCIPSPGTITSIAMGRGDGGGDGDDDEKKFGLTLSASKMISLEDKDDGHHQAAENLITYTWPEVFVPKNVRVSHHVAEKLRFYGDQQFVIDDKSGTVYLYKNILHDSRKIAGRLRSGQHVVLIGGNTFETIVTIFGVLLADAVLIVLEADITEAQLDQTIERFKPIIFIAPCSTRERHLRHLQQRFRPSYTISCADASRTGEAATTTQSQVFYLSELGGVGDRPAFDVVSSAIKPTTDRVLVPIFRRNRLVKVYRISEYSLMTQLTYTTLPQTGFEWNINDVVLSTRPFASLVGLLELLVTTSVGACLVLPPPAHRLLRLSNPFDVSRHLARLVNRHQVTACLLHSSHLLALLKADTISCSMTSLRKVVYLEQPVHRALVAKFKQKFALHSCRFALYMLEASGFAAIEVQPPPSSPPPPTTTIEDEDGYSLVAPLPNTVMKIVALEKNEIGKVFIKCHYRSTIDDGRGGPRRSSNLEGWVFTGFVGFHDQHRRLQVIDYYRNLLKCQGRFYSKTLLETIILFRWPLVQWASIGRRPRHQQELIAKMIFNACDRAQVHLDKLVRFLQDNCPDGQNFTWTLRASYR